MENCFVKVCGGVGNQLFQLAAGYAYSKDHNKNLLIDIGEWTASQGSNPIVYKDELFKNFNYHFYSTPNTPTIEESDFRSSFPYVDGNVEMRGYFQSLKYFKNCKDEFVKLLNFPEINTSFITEKSVAFHIRRGDYLAYKDIHIVCDTNYFGKMFDKFKDYQINVFTDSPAYVLKEFENRDFNLIQSKTELKDMVAMSKHKIIVGSNSSFSWWASLIGNCECYFPSKWFADGREHSDIYRKDMKIINV